jgi:hypothetical protein
MARTETKWIYTFEELDASAKARARQWWREGMEVDHDCTTDWLVEVCAALEIEINLKKVYWRGFCSQGDGSSYSGDVHAYTLMQHVDNGAWHTVAPKLELANSPDLSPHVVNLLERRDAIVRASCGESRGYDGEFNLHTEHDIDCYNLDDRRHTRIAAQLSALGEWAESVLDAVNDWFYRALESEYEYQNSDAMVDETIEINGYEFDIDGGIA